MSADLDPATERKTVGDAAVFVQSFLAHLDAMSSHISGAFYL